MCLVHTSNWVDARVNEYRYLVEGRTVIWWVTCQIEQIDYCIDEWLPVDIYAVYMCVYNTCIHEWRRKK